jgi:hypothetical protein
MKVCSELTSPKRQQGFVKFSEDGARIAMETDAPPGGSVACTAGSVRRIGKLRVDAR